VGADGQDVAVGGHDALDDVREVRRVEERGRIVVDVGHGYFDGGEVGPGGARARARAPGARAAAAGAVLALDGEAVALDALVVEVLGDPENARVLADTKVPV